MPVVFVPVLEVFVSVDGSIENGVELSVGASIKASVGLEYRPSTGVRPIKSFETEFNAVPTLNVSSSLSAGFTPLRPELNLLLYGIEGPYLAVDFPRYEAELRAQSQPSGINLKAEAVFSGAVGFEVSVKKNVLGLKLGLDLNYATSIDQRFLILARFFPKEGLKPPPSENPPGDTPPPPGDNPPPPGDTPPPPGENPPPPADNRKIAFVSSRDVDQEIFIINADGTGEKQLTNNTSDDFSPSISADGSRIAFVSNRDGDLEVFVINTDGTGEKQLTFDAFVQDLSIGG